MLLGHPIFLGILVFWLAAPANLLHSARISCASSIQDRGTSRFIPILRTPLSRDRPSQAIGERE